MKISSVDPDSPLFGHVRPGHKLVSINGAEVLDEIDYRYKTADEQVELIIANNNGQESAYRFDADQANDIGLNFEEQRIKTCKCNCIFCFVLQQPKGMRRTLYVKDEDYRLSFTHGNFVTLSNTTDADLERIVEQRLSPMYISVHAADDTLRRCMLRNEKLAPIIPRLKYLTENGIEVHSQVVLCPGVNDGPALDYTITQLASLYPGVGTLAVVPVGLTKYRERLPNLRPYSTEEAARNIRQVARYQRQYLKSIGTRFVWAADEFYVIANKKLPSYASYEEMNQFENGIGMAREFITMFNRRRSRLRGIKSEKRVLFLTGRSAYPFFSSELMPYINNELGLDISLTPVTNQFWGDTVTVSGLLTGQDLLRAAREQVADFDTVVLPPNCLNDDDLFLDNLSLDQFRQVLGKEVVGGSYDLARTIREVMV